MKPLSVLFSLILLFFGLNANANTKRALFMAIDTYLPDGAENKSSRSFGNLSGCVNDAEEVKSIVATKYGFNDENFITFIKNQECTRERILKELNKLIDESQAGDVVFIYYAGHGAQVYNSLSEEADKMDESMVPADIWTGKAKDIRDKELAVLFNKLIDKGVTLTVIFDSCHSGSVGRGPMTNKPAKVRIADSDMEDAKDATRITIAPEDRGALIMSAAQDNECASEQTDENGQEHGAFTIAFCKAMRNLPATSSASEIFASLRAIMKYNGKTQEPVIAGNQDRKANTLFGIDRGALPKGTFIAVMNPESQESVTLQAGTALGLANGCILTNGDNSVELSIIEVNSMTKSTAKVTKGNFKNVKPGDLFHVTQWVVSENALTVYIPTSTLTYAQIKAFAEEFFKLKENPNIEWIIDPSKVSATHTIFYNEGMWYLGTPDNKTFSLGVNPSFSQLKKLLNGKNIRLYVSLPPYAGLKAKIEEAYKDNTSVRVVSAPANANYYLAGRVYENQVQYAFIMPGIIATDTAYASTMPIRTDFIQMNGKGDTTAIDSLAEYTFTLAKIKIWMTLNGPADGMSSFPFHLALKNSKTNEIVSAGNVVNGETYGLVLVPDKANIDAWYQNPQKRYVYVFSIDADGNTKLLYGKGVENQMPRLNDKNEVPDYIPLGPQPSFRITPPYGVDTYVILTSDEPITNVELLENKGVRNRGDNTRGGGKKTWADMFKSAGTGTRGNDPIAPSNWSVVRVTVRTVAK